MRCCRRQVPRLKREIWNLASLSNHPCQGQMVLKIYIYARPGHTYLYMYVNILYVHASCQRPHLSPWVVCIDGQTY